MAVYEVDLAQHIRHLWRVRLPILATALVCAGVALAWTLLSAPVYEAAVAMSATRSKLDEASLAEPSTASYRPFIENLSLVSKVVREFDLAKPPASLTAIEFLESRLSVQEVRNSSVLLVKCRLHDPKLVAAVVNRVGDLASDSVLRFSQDQAVRSRDEVKKEYDGAIAFLGEVEARLRRFKEMNQIDLLRNDVDAMLGQRGKLLALLIEIEAEKAKLAKAEQELSQRTRIDTVKRSIDSEPALLEAARTPSSSPAELLSVTAKSEYMNPVYQELDQQVAEIRTNLASLEQQKVQMVGVRKLDAVQFSALNGLYKADAELKRLQVEHELALKAYSEVALAYRTASLRIFSRRIDLQVAERAVEPDQPLARHAGRNGVLGLAAGLLLASIVVLARNALAAAR